MASGLDGPEGDDDLVARIGQRELLWPQIGSGELVEDAGRRQHVAVGLHLDVAGPERLLGDRQGGVPREVPPLPAPLLSLELRDPGHRCQQHAAGGEDPMDGREGRADVVDELERPVRDHAVERFAREVRGIREIAHDRRVGRPLLRREDLDAVDVHPVARRVVRCLDLEDASTDVRGMRADEALHVDAVDRRAAPEPAARIDRRCPPEHAEIQRSIATPVEVDALERT